MCDLYSDLERRFQPFRRRGRGHNGHSCVFGAAFVRLDEVRLTCRSDAESESLSTSEILMTHRRDSVFSSEVRFWSFVRDWIAMPLFHAPVGSKLLFSPSHSAF